MKNFIKLLIVTFLIATSITKAQQSGSISGTVIDAESGDKLISATVLLKDKTGKTITGSRTKFDGTYLIKNIKAGVYNLTVNYLGYQSKTIENVDVKPNGVLKFDLELSTDVVLTEEVIVEAKAVKETGSALLKDRQKAAAAQDAIGGEEMTKKGAGDAGEALKKVTGVTIVDGKSLVVRGLSDRYAKTQLNGASLPSADPDSRTVDLDLFSSNMIENIVTIKTATPDKPGDFTGGAVDIKTKSYPDKFFSKLSVSTNYNTQVTGTSILQSPSSSTDWVGRDDGKRDIAPEINSIFDKYGEFPNINNIFRKEGTTKINGVEYQNEVILNDVTNAAKALNNTVMAPVSVTAPMNNGLSLSIGNQYSIGETPIGFTANFNYDRNYSFYDKGIFAIWENNDISADSLNEVSYYHDTKGEENVLMGGLLSLSTTLFKYNEISFNAVYNQAGSNTGRYISGRWPGSSGIPTRGFSSWSNRYVERGLQSYQFKGQHKILDLLKSTLDWQIASSTNSRYEPNFSLFGFDWVPSKTSTIQNSSPDLANPQYGITASAYDEPARIFRNMDENNLNYNVNYEIPLDDVVGIPFKFKTGYFHEAVDRKFEEYWFIYKWGNKSFPNENVNGDPFVSDPINNPNEIFKNLVGYSENGKFIEPNMYLLYQSPIVNSYNAESKINAFYGMVDFKLFNKLRIITGARLEESRLVAIPYDTSAKTLNLFKSEYYDQGGDTTGVTFADFGVDESDLLPSINIVYEESKDMNLRLAYYRTIARPNLREIAPYNSFDFIGGFLLLGNPFLQRSVIDNYDIRLEIFPNAGEILAASFYYKDFQNPIEKSIVSTNGQIRYQNAKEGFVLGSEFELRKNTMNLLYSLTGSELQFLKYIDLSFNLALTYAKVGIPKNSRDADNILQADITKIKEQLISEGVTPEEAQSRAEATANPDLTRDFVGQSPFVVNFDISYSNPELGLNISSNFNVFGRRLDFIQFGIDPDVYELPRPDLNFIISKKFLESFNVRFSANNLLNSWTTFAQRYKDNDFYNRRYQLGSSFSLSISYSLN